MADSIEERLKKMRSGKSNSSSAATTSTVQNRLDAMRSSGSNQQSSGGATAPAAVSAQNNGYTPVADLNRATNGAGVSPLEQAARDVAARGNRSGRDGNRNERNDRGEMLAEAREKSGFTPDNTIDNMASALWNDEKSVAANIGGTFLDLGNRLDYAASGDRQRIENARHNLETYAANRDAATTPEERERWQRLADAAQRQIDSYTELANIKGADTAQGAKKLYDASDVLYQNALRAQAEAEAGKSDAGRLAVRDGLLLGNIGTQVAAELAFPGIGTALRVVDIAGRAARDYRQQAGDEYNPVVAGVRGIAGGAGVLAGGALARAIGRTGSAVLQSQGLNGKIIPRIGMGAASGLGYALGEIPITEIAAALTDPNYTPDEQAINKRIGSAVAFGALSQFLAGITQKFRADEYTVADPQRQMKWFTEDMTPEDAAKLRRSLARQYHPDAGGDAAIMQEINDEYSYFLQNFANRANAAYHSASNAAAAGDGATYEAASAEYREAIGFLREAVADGAITGEAAEAVGVLSTIADTGIPSAAEETPTPATPPAPLSEAAPEAPAELLPTSEGIEGLQTVGNVAPTMNAQAKNNASAQTQEANKLAVESIANTLGETGKGQMLEAYDGTSDALQYAQGFLSAYNNGRASVTGEQVARNETMERSALTLNDAQRQIAWRSGVVDAEREAGIAQTANTEYNNAINQGTEGMNNERAVSVWDGGERYASQNTGEQVRVVAESAGRNQAGQAQSRPAEGGGAVSSYAGQQVSSAQLGIAGGDTNDSVTVYNGENTREVKKAKKLAAERGVKLKLFAGGDIHQGNVAARGAYDASTGTVYARVDDADYTVDQIVRHELGHDMFAKGELDLDAIREQVKHAAPNGNVDALAEKYVSAYEGAGLTAEEAWEECVCDALGGMNEFGRWFESESGNYADAQQQLRSAARETQGARAPPSRSGRDADASRERAGHRGRGDENDDVSRSRQSGSTVSESGVDTATFAEATTPAEAEQSGFKFSRVTDKETLDFLNNQETIKVYRAMQLIDGKLYPPMAAKVASEGSSKRQLVEPTELDTWYRSDERPDLIDPKTGKFKLDKANGTVVPAAYNPYFHTSATPLNDQFTSAYKRPNLVTVEVEIPKSELTSGYKAQYAKDSVGETAWHSGVVASQLKGEKARRVFLSRWAKVNRIIPDSEVARVIAKTLEGENIAVPYNVVTPSLRAELEKAGVEISQETKGLKLSQRMDSEGRQLTEGQERYFKDSKVRDENGNLLVLYHGGFATGGNGDGNVFAGRGGGFTYNPNSIYLTSAKDVAQAFGGRHGRLYELYADIKNPIVLDAQGRSYVDIPIADDAPESLKDYFSMTETADADNLPVYAEEYGYDGVIIYNVREGVGGEPMTEVIALRPEQVKDAGNQTPTRNPDIRFSRKLGEERIFRTPQGVEVVQNPTDSEYAQMRSEVYKAYPWLRETGEPPLRRTFDEEGNIYYWSSADGIHAMVEPYINREFETRTSQHWKWWEKPDKDYYPIQYSRRLSELDALREQNEDLRERVDELKTASREAKKQAARADYWQGQTKRTTAPTVREGDIKRVAKDIISGYDSALKADDIAEGLKSVGDYLVQADELTYKGLKERAAEVARKVVENASVLTNSETMDIYRDVKSTLGQEMTISAQDAHWIPDWGDWRKRNRSKVNVRINGSANAQPVDVAYTALSEEYPWLFPDEITNPSDQLLQMVDALDSLAPVYQNPYSYDMAQAVEYCTNDIIDMLLSERVRQTAPTFADRQAAKLDEANARTARVRAEERQRADERVARVRDEKNAKIERVREEGRERIDRLREQKNARIAEIKRQGREKMREAVEREAERRERQVEAIKQHYQTQKFEQAERRADSAARTKLLSLVRRMQRMNTNGANRALLNELIGDIDSVSKSITGKSVEKLSDLRDWYLEQKENDPDFISDPHIEKALERLQKRHVADMSLQEVMELTDVLRNIENELRTERRLIDSEDRRDTYMQGIESISNIENSRGSKGGIIDSLVTTELLTPTREMRRVTGYVDDDPLYRLTRDLEAGQRKMFDYTRRAGERFRKWVDDKKLTRRIAGKHAEEIKIQGIGKNGITEVTITPAMRMSLYLHSKNDQNLRHIAGGGITVPDIKLYKQGKLAEAYARGTTVKLEPSQVRSIVAHMTAEERAFADATSAYFNGMSRDAINETSEKLKGYSLAGVENYFPINTDSSFTKKEMDTIKFDGTIEGMGFLKERVNAANPIMLRDMNTVLTQAIDQHARYVGLAIPVRNFNKVYGVTKASFNEDGSRNGFEGSVQQAIKQKWGNNAANYIEKMMSDLQGPRGTTDAWGQRLAKLRSNYAGATLELNASVAVKQSASYPTAAAVVGWSPLIKALADPRKVNVDTVAKYTPLLWYRSQGYSSQELGDIAKSGKSLPKVLNWIQGMDVATTTELWQAAEYYVRARDKTLTRGTDAYYKAVAEVYNRIIEETQPNYTTMQRPQLLRSDNEFVKALNMFKTQPFQNYNVLYDALGNLRAKQTKYRNIGGEENKAALREAQTNAARAISSQIVSAFVFALMQYAWDAFRGKDDKYKDDDGEQTLLSWLKGMGLNMVGSGFGMVPFGSEALELGENLTDKILQSFGLDPFFEQKWYGFDEAATGALTDASNSGLSALVQTITTLQKALDSDKELTDADIESYVRQLVKAAGDVGSLSGTPLNNIKNLFTAAARQIFRRTDGEYVGGYKALRLTSDPSKYASDYYDLLYDAYKNDKGAYKEVYQLMTDSERFSADKIASAIEQRMKKDAGVESVSDLSQRYLDPTQQAKYDKSLKAVQGSAVWRNANTTQRDAALDMIYDYAVGNSDGKKISEKVASGKRYGINETQYILYRVALAVADAQNSDATKRNGSYDQDEATRAAQMMNGVSGDGLGWLWASTNSGWKDKNNPYK